VRAYGIRERNPWKKKPVRGEKEKHGPGNWPYGPTSLTGEGGCRSKATAKESTGPPERRPQKEGDILYEFKGSFPLTPLSSKGDAWIGRGNPLSSPLQEENEKGPEKRDFVFFFTIDWPLIPEASFSLRGGKNWGLWERRAAEGFAPVVKKGLSQF